MSKYIVIVEVDENVLRLNTNPDDSIPELIEGQIGNLDHLGISIMTVIES